VPLADVPFGKDERTWVRLNAQPAFAALRDQLLDLVRTPAAALSAV